MKIRFSIPKYPTDIILFMIWSLILIPITLLDVEGPIRIIAGLPFILFIPGYLLVFTLFPEKKTDHGIDIIERIALSFGLSLAIVPLIGFGLNYTTWGIRLAPILFSLFFFNIIIGFIGIYRWLQTNEESRFKIDFTLNIPREKNNLDKALTLILIISIILTISLLIYVISIPKTGEKFTEFYLLGSNNLADEYPKDLLIGENTSVTIGIVNHEYKQMNYRIEIWLINQSLSTNTITNTSEVLYHHMYFMDSITVNLDHLPVDIESNWTAQWEYDYDFTISRTGTYKLAFLLFIEPINQVYTKGIDYKEIAHQKLSDAYRSLHLWITIQ